MRDRIGSLFVVYLIFGVVIAGLETSLLSGDFFRITLPTLHILLILHAATRLPLLGTMGLAICLGLLTEMNSLAPRGVFQLGFCLLALASSTVHQYFPIQTKSRMLIMGAAASITYDGAIAIGILLADASLDTRSWLLGLFPRALVLSLITAQSIQFLSSVQERAVEHE